MVKQCYRRWNATTNGYHVNQLNNVFTFINIVLFSAIKFLDKLNT